MKFRVLSDIHADSWKEKRSVTDIIAGNMYPADAILMAGDFGNSLPDIKSSLSAASDSYPHCFFCLGNHDLCVHWDDKDSIRTTEDKIEAVRSFASAKSNIHMLDGTIETLGTVKIGGCTGWWDPDLDDPYECEDWLYGWFDGLNMNYGTLEHATLKEQGKIRTVLSGRPDIMMTHFAPDTINTNPKYAGSFSNRYFYFSPKKYDFSGVRYWVCGHTHDAHISKMGDTVILCNPYGYLSRSHGPERPYDLNHLSQNDFIVEIE